MNEAINQRIIYMTILMAQTFRNEDLCYLCKQGTIIHLGACQGQRGYGGCSGDGNYKYQAIAICQIEEMK